jgi:hypothetical protein
MLLNNPLAIEAAQALATRIEREVGKDVEGQITRVFELALQRRPEQAEVASCTSLLGSRSLADLCRAMLNVNEFIYVD